MSTVAVLRIARGGSGTAERLDSFEVPYRPGQSILDGLMWIREHVDPSLAFRFACINANACKEGTYAGHVERDPVSRLRDVGHVARELPVTAEQDILFEFGQLFVVICSGRKSAAIPVHRSPLCRDFPTHPRLPCSGAVDAARAPAGRSSTEPSAAFPDPCSRMRRPRRTAVREPPIIESAEVIP